MIAKIVTTNRQSKENALICICSAHQDVIKAAFSFLQKNPTICLSIESTVQQVNQDGGYTGMVPKDYVAMVYKIAETYNIPKESYILAGDHLGPNAWKHLAAEEAMKKSLVLVEEYVNQGNSTARRAAKCHHRFASRQTVLISVQLRSPRGGPEPPGPVWFDLKRVRIKK
jgi:D-tagatose-1,6-bisphosphate aldolase subunit GatZ/KbaZ